MLWKPTCSIVLMILNKPGPFLNKIRQIRRETQNDLLSLLPEGSWVFADQSNQHEIPVRNINTATGTTLRVFNGGLAD